MNETLKEGNSQGMNHNYGNVGQTTGFKRYAAYKFKIGQIISGNQVFDQDKLNFIEINNKRTQRVNVIANIVDKYLQEGEKDYGTATLDDASGQIKVKVFGEDVEKIKELRRLAQETKRFNRQELTELIQKYETK